MDPRSIGFIKFPLLEETDEDQGNGLSDIVWKDEFSIGLLDIDQFYHDFLNFYIPFDPDDHLLRCPQGRQTGGWYLCPTCETSAYPRRFDSGGVDFKKEKYPQGERPRCHQQDTHPGYQALFPALRSGKRTW